MFQKFVPIVNCIFRKAFNASLGKCKLTQVINVSKFTFQSNFRLKFEEIKNIFEVLSQMCINASFFPPYFPAHFVRFLFSFFSRFNFFHFLYSFTKLKACTVCTNAQASIFTVFWPSFSHRLKLLNSCQNKSERYNEQVVKSKPRSGWPFFRLNV